MNIYFIITMYHLLEIIAYQKKYFPEKKAVILMPSFLYCNINNITALKTMFKTIIKFDIIEQYNEQSEPKDITYYIDNLLIKHNLDIKQFDNIFVAGAQLFSGIYMIQKNIDFIFFEEAGGLLSKQDVLKEIDLNLNPKRYEFCNKNGLYDGTNSLITKVICNKNLQDNALHNLENYEHFDIVDTIKTFSAEDKEQIIKVFLDHKYKKLEKEAVIVFTQHFSNLKIHTLENHCLIYQIFIDYFYPEKHIIFKTHPNDLIFYGLLFPHATIIRDKFPSELLPIIITNEIEEISTICSTAVKNLDKYYNNTFSLDFDYGHTTAFLSTHKVYVGLSYVSKQDKSYNIYIEGYPKSLFEGFIKKIFTNLIIVDDFNSADYIFIDDYYTSNENILHKYYCKLKNNQKIIYISSKALFLEYKLFYSETNNIFPIVITKKTNRKENIYQDLSDEIVYILNKNVNNTEFGMEKELDSTGITLKTDKLSQEQIRIKVLEGILEATEKRLVYLLEENQNLKEKLGETK